MSNAIVTTKISDNDTRSDRDVQHPKSTQRTRRHSSTQLAQPFWETLPAGMPPKSRQVSWAEMPAQGNEHLPRDTSNTLPPPGHEPGTSRQQYLANSRTDRRITNKDRLDMSIIGEFPAALLPLKRQPIVSMTSSVPYLPNNILQFFLPSQSAGPDNFFVPSPEFLRNIKTVMSHQPAPPTCATVAPD